MSHNKGRQRLYEYEIWEWSRETETYSYRGVVQATTTVHARIMALGKGMTKGMATRAVKLGVKAPVRITDGQGGREWLKRAERERRALKR